MRVQIDSSQVDAELRKLYRKSIAEGDSGVIVGFTQTYAVHVHEINMPHRVGQWKFLQAAYMNQRPLIGKYVAKVYEKTRSLTKGLIAAGLKIQAVAQKLTPVDTGALKASAYTAKIEDAPAVARKTFAKSEAIRKRKKA